jgi:hypothetical protein
VVVLLAGVAGCPSGKPGRGRIDTDSEPPGSPTPDYTVKAVDLCKEYEADATAADAKYKGKWLLVEGPVAPNGVKPGFMVGLSVELGEYRPEPDRSGRSVRADMADAWLSKARALSDTQVVKIKGKCQGDAGLWVDLVQCELVAEGADPALVVTAAQLTKEAADPGAASKKYQGKPMRVEGTVVEVLKSPGGVPDVVVLAGHDERAANPARVHASYPGAWARHFEGLKKGQKVTLKANWAGARDARVALDGARPVP